MKCRTTFITSDLTLIKAYIYHILGQPNSKLRYSHNSFRKKNKDIILTSKLRHSALRPFLITEGSAAITAVRFAVSRGPRILNQCVTVSSKFLLAIYRKARERIFFVWPAQTTSKKNCSLQVEDFAGFYKLRQPKGSDWCELLDKKISLDFFAICTSTRLCYSVPFTQRNDSNYFHYKAVWCVDTWVK